MTGYETKGSLTEYIKSAKEGNSDINYHYNDTQKLIHLYIISAAMSHLHCNKIIHGHLKPNNILINDQYNPIITDFLFKKLNRQYQNNYLESNTKDKRTIIYLPPEVIFDSQYSSYNL
mgnify:FL=1